MNMSPQQLQEVLKGATRVKDLVPGQTQDWIVFTEEGVDATINVVLYQALECCVAEPIGDQYHTAQAIRQRIKQRFGLN